MNQEYFDVHLSPSIARLIAWEELLRFIAKFVKWQDMEVLDAGCGRGELLSCLASSANATGLDLYIDPNLREKGYRLIESSVTSFDSSSSHFGVVFASNLLEHLEMEQIQMALNNFNQVLTERGHLIILQPNFRYAFRKYFDDYTHKSIFTDKSLPRLLEAHGFSIVELWPGIFPYSVELVSPKVPKHVLRWLIRIYLRLPIRPFSGQMLIIAKKNVA